MAPDQGSTDRALIAKARSTPTMSHHLTDDPEVASRLATRVAAARLAGYDDPIYGALVISVMVEIGLEREAPAGRHPKGKAAGGV